MPDYTRLAALAKECGFTHCAPLDAATLDFMQEVRDMCGAGKCDGFGKSWSCPPAGAELRELRERAGKFPGGILVQTVGEIEDSCDWEGIMGAGARQKRSFARMRGELRKEYGDVFAMGTGACKACQICTYPDAPCRSPDAMEVSMEACGLLVSKVCADNGLAYNYGPKRIAFTSCFLVV